MIAPRWLTASLSPTPGASWTPMHPVIPCYVSDDGISLLFLRRRSNRSVLA
jgi:hypothetical protein